MDEIGFSTTTGDSSPTAVMSEPNAEYASQPSSNKGSVVIPLEPEDVPLNVLTNTSPTNDDTDMKLVTNNVNGSMKSRPPPPNFEPPPSSTLNEHRTLQNRHSAPPSSPPPVFTPETSTNMPVVSPEGEKENNNEDNEDDLDKDEDDNVHQTDCTEYDDDDEEEDDDDHRDNDNKTYPKGILRHRSSVRDPNSVQDQQKSVTFGKLPTRRDEPNPCVLLVLFIVFIVSAISFLLVLLLSKGTIKSPCNCKDEIKDSEKEILRKVLSCPMGWSVGENSCYGTVTGEHEVYSRARSMCAVQGAYILSLETESESKWFTDNIMNPRRTRDQNVGDIFLGIKPNQSRDDEYAWESNNKFLGWKYGLSPAGNESCFVIANNDTSAWLNVDCDIKHSFYCEKTKYLEAQG